MGDVVHTARSVTAAFKFAKTTMVAIDKRKKINIVKEEISCDVLPMAMLLCFVCFFSARVGRCRGKAETQKVKTFRLPEFHAQKLSGRSA